MSAICAIVTTWEIAAYDVSCYTTKTRNPGGQAWLTQVQTKSPPDCDVHVYNMSTGWFVNRLLSKHTKNVCPIIALEVFSLLYRSKRFILHLLADLFIPTPTRLRTLGSVQQDAITLNVFDICILFSVGNSTWNVTLMSSNCGGKPKRLHLQLESIHSIDRSINFIRSHTQPDDWQAWLQVWLDIWRFAESLCCITMSHRYALDSCHCSSSQFINSAILVV